MNMLIICIKGQILIIHRFVINYIELNLKLIEIEINLLVVLVLQ